MKGARVTVTTTPTELARSSGSVTVTNRGATTIDMGGDYIATGEGHELRGGESYSLDLDGDTLYGITASGSQEIQVLYTGTT